MVLRFSLPITPDASKELDWLIITMSLVAVVYIGFVALVQQDEEAHRLLVDRTMDSSPLVSSSFHHPGAQWSIAATVLGIRGGMVQMVSHGFISAAMFLCVRCCLDRMHSRESTTGGVVNVMPWFAAFMVVFAMANAGLPTPRVCGWVHGDPGGLPSQTSGLPSCCDHIDCQVRPTRWMVKRVVYGVGSAKVAALRGHQQARGIGTQFSGGRRVDSRSLACTPIGGDGRIDREPGQTHCRDQTVSTFSEFKAQTR